MLYQNPVINIEGMDHGDPAVLKYNGTYYLYHTGHKEIPVYQSTNLIDWEACGIALKASEEDVHWAQIQLWAPEVIYENGTFYMYVTGAVKDDQGHAIDAIRRIGVAKSTSPLGPFTLSPTPLTNEWSIDAHPFKDDDGQYYMFYNVRNEFTTGPNNVIGTGNVVDRMVDLETLSQMSSLVVRPEHSWEGNKDHSFFWNEGPFVVKREGTYYQMYSAGFFGDDTYSVSYATSDFPLGKEQGMTTKGWKKWNEGKAILHSNEACLGPGHHVVVKGPNGLDDYIVYHGYEREAKIGRRKVRVGRTFFQNQHIEIEPPTKESLPYPGLPTFDGRQITNIETINDHLRQHQYKNYLFETNVRFSGGKEDAHHFTVQVNSEEEMLECIIDRKKRVVSIHKHVNAKKCAEEVRVLNSSFRFEVYHSLKVMCENNLISVYLDGVRLYSTTSYHREASTIQLNGTKSCYEVIGSILHKTT